MSALQSSAKKKNAGVRRVIRMEEAGIDDVKDVGGKNASLGEMYRNLTKKGVNVPNGFAITADSYFYLLDATGIRKEIKSVLKDLNTSNIKNLQDHGKAVRQLIRTAEFPADLENFLKSPALDFI